MADRHRAIGHDPYLTIARAAQAGRGCRLSAVQVRNMVGHTDVRRHAEQHPSYPWWRKWRSNSDDLHFETIDPLSVHLYDDLITELPPDEACVFADCTSEELEEAEAAGFISRTKIGTYRVEDLNWYEYDRNALWAEKRRRDEQLAAD